MIAAQTFDRLLEWARAIHAWSVTPFVTIGEVGFSLATLIKLLLYGVVLLLVSRALRRLLTRRVLPRFHMEPGVTYALANIAFYVVLTLGLLVGIQTSGVDLSSLTVIFGALGVGIGFGLQEIAANFVSGLILLLERPIQIGDVVEVGDIHGQIVRIDMRATRLETNDGIAVIVPNKEFISQRVINWSRGRAAMRVRVPVGVAYGSDVEQVRDVLLGAARQVSAVMADPQPQVRLSGFGDSTIDFELLVWTRELLQQRGELISRVNFAVHAALKQHEIVIPFPQRDLHLRSSIAFPVAPDR